MGDREKSEDTTVYLLFEVWSLMHGVGALLDKALAGSGLNADEFGFFSVLVDNQPITPKRISELVGMPATTVSSYLNRLIASGHISKTRNPADGRSFLVELTPKGFAVQYEAWKRFVPAQDAVIDNLQPPTQEILDALKQLIEAVRAATPPD
jgi:DNA-binding MarR family transcriptional regulator